MGESMQTAMVLVPPGFWVACFFLLGAILGSFVNAAVYRLPRGISLLTRTRSFCPQCNAQISWYDNMPILSYLLLGGRCRACHKPIPRRYLWVELCVSTLFALSAWQYFGLNRPSPPAALSPMPAIFMAVQMFLIADLACATFTDLETWYIPDQTTAPWILAGLLLAVLCPELHDPSRGGSASLWTASPRGNALIDSFQGLVLGAGILWLAGFVCIVLLHKEGMGGGDARLVGMVGALLGWKPALATFVLGIFLGLIGSLSLLTWDRIQQSRLGEAWKPRQPTFEIPEDETAEGPEPAWPLLAIGLVVVAFEGALLCLSLGAGAVWWDSKHFAATFGAVIGAFCLLAYPIRKQMVATGRWPKGETREREDGKKEEILHGNYIPFGPWLALAGLLVAFYDPLIRAFAWWWFFGRLELTAWMSAAGMNEVPWSLYLQGNPLPFKLLGM